MSLTELRTVLSYVDDGVASIGAEYTGRGLKDILNRIDYNLNFAESLTSKFMEADKVIGLIEGATPELLILALGAKRTVDTMATAYLVYDKLISGSISDDSTASASVQRELADGERKVLFDGLSKLDQEVEALVLEVATIASNVADMYNAGILSAGDRVRFVYDVPGDDIGGGFYIKRGVVGTVLDVYSKAEIYLGEPTALLSVGDRELLVPLSYIVKTEDTIADVYRELAPNLDVLEFEDLIKDVIALKDGNEALEVETADGLALLEFYRTSNGKVFTDNHRSAVLAYIGKEEGGNV